MNVGGGDERYNVNRTNWGFHLDCNRPSLLKRLAPHLPNKAWIRPQID